MINFSTIKAGDMITYLGDSLAFCGEYIVMKAEDTYVNVEQCPQHLHGKLMIAEFMNDGVTPMFFTLDMLDTNEWDLYVDDSEFTVEVMLDDKN